MVSAIKITFWKFCSVMLSVSLQAGEERNISEWGGGVLAQTSLLGFTFEMDNTGATEEYAMAVDARARYAINDQLSVTGMFNWTAGDEISSGENKDAKYASWGMVNVTYKMNDTIQPFCSVIYSAGKKCGTKGRGKSCWRAKMVRKNHLFAFFLG